MNKNNKNIIDEKVREITKRETLNNSFVESNLIDKGVLIDILKDSLNDNKKESSKKNVTTWILILAFVGYIFYSQWNVTNLVKESDIRFKEFLSQFDFDDTINQNLHIDGNSTVTDTNKIGN